MYLKYADESKKYILSSKFLAFDNKYNKFSTEIKIYAVFLILILLFVRMGGGRGGDVRREKLEVRSEEGLHLTRYVAHAVCLWPHAEAQRLRKV